MQKVVKKLFFPWNEDEEKKFLEEMSLKGYQLTRVQLGRYTFEKSEPKRVIYQFDFKGIDSQDEQEYLQLYEDAGWNLVYKHAGWYYFNREWTGEEFDLSIFNNNRSKSIKYKRLLFFLLITGFPLYYNTLILFPALRMSNYQMPGYYSVFIIFMAVLTVLHIFVVLRIARLYWKLVRSIKE